MAKNRKKQSASEEVKARVKKVDPIQELEREEAESIAEQEAEELAGEFEIREEVDEQLEPEDAEEYEALGAGGTSEEAGRPSLREKFRKKRLSKKEALKKQHKWTMPIWLRVSASVLLIAGLSIVFTWFILWRSNLCDAGVTNTFIGEKPRLFAYSCMIVFALYTDGKVPIAWRSASARGFFVGGECGRGGTVR